MEKKKRNILNFSMILGICFIIVGLIYGYLYYKQDYIIYNHIEMIINEDDVSVNDSTVQNMLYLPTLKKQIPIISYKNEESLLYGCCLFYEDDNHIVIMGHNNGSVFKDIRKLKIDDCIYINDQKYKVCKKEILNEYDYDEMVYSLYDLTLFTCTYDSRNRYTIRLNLD